MKAEKTRKFLRYHCPYNGGITRTQKIDNLEKDGVLKELEELEYKSEKWDMIEWAINNLVDFIAVDIESNNTYLSECDFERLEKLYAERGGK